jgi:hypothetical protein
LKQVKEAIDREILFGCYLLKIKVFDMEDRLGQTRWLHRIDKDW